jgi:sugar transferase (PEP-CTERM/EpsH1 system associated)
MDDLLFLAQRIPYPPNKGDKIRSWHVLERLARDWRVHLGAFVDDEADWTHQEVLERSCASVNLVPLVPRMAKLRSLVGLAAGEALTLPYFRDPRMSGWVDEVLRARAPGAIFVFSSAMAQYVLPRRGPARLVIDMVDMDSAKWRQYAANQRWPMSWIYAREAARLHEFERRAANAADVTLFVSRAEAELFRRTTPGLARRVDWVGNGVDLEYFAPGNAGDSPFAPGETAIVFTGMMDYWPNIDAVTWFAEAVWPDLTRRHDRLRFVIVGANPTPAVQLLARKPGITVTGRVADVRPYIAHAQAAVAPLRVAQGIQNKVLEAMAMAKPVIASPQALEGLDASDGDGVLVAAGSAEYGAGLERLLSDGAALGARARAHVERHYRWEGNLDRVVALVRG